jgi:hypothetical protein
MQCLPLRQGVLNGVIMTTNMKSPVLLAALLASAAGAQENATGRTKADPPKTSLAMVQAVEQHEGGQRQLSLRFVNQSEKAIVAYVIKTEAYDSSGKAGGATCSLRLRGALPGMQDWQPGETIDDAVRLATPATVKPSIDYVLYSDGSAEGPDSCGESLRVKGMQVGIRVERSRLKRILTEKGYGALVEDLLRDSKN